MKALLKLSIAICSVALVTGCEDKVDHTKIRQDGFVYCDQGRPSTFNPQLVDGGIIVEAIAPQLYDTLLTLNPGTHQPVPNLAKSWTVDETGTVYHFNLRDDVQFQTTEWFTPTRPLNADDVVFSFNRILDENNPYHQVGGSVYPWFAGINFSALVTSVTALDANTVQFTLSKPDNSFLSNISTAHAPIFSAEYAKILLDSNSKQRIDSYPVGTGPFYLDEYQVSDLVRLKRNEQYWRGPVQMKQVVFDISHRGAGALAKLLRGECDVLNSPVSSQIPVILKEDSVILQAKPAMNVSFIAINTQHGALSDVRVRKAINLAINRDSILEAVYYGTGEKAYTLLPPSSWAYQKDPTQIRYDRNYAMALLRDAGYANGLELTLAVPLEPRVYNPSPRKTAELIQANLADVGITLNLLTDERVDRKELSNIKAVDLLLTGWVGNTGDPDNYLRPLLSCSSKREGLNLSMWCNDDFDFLLDLALEVSEPRYRANLYRQAQNILYDQIPVIPLAHGQKYQAHNDDLTGFRTSPFNTQPFDQVVRLK
ncbi:ABC transporter substrate-binding protein [Vibrio sp. 10N.286.49.C2]|uniref:ABC transporter substrate-binding protein SapA n=1 Tax=unclassified Vibrio TaxID=2614977 RepID=UPI000C8168AE|nr:MULTISPECIES: ABC transporter substrate-binding protein SapA [unclassified Vibrio]PMH40653.1 ABC transporter substrate-binding protein [Vibrio sp. 10N.286.49.C2]PMH45184.1 ABC transporter substrate-binding protein [Vibrio sp. 10N.286.49.B1]PMH78918.1 ABC transporter substrate-binding protein [Vibrio sp. 10N.286.48.B7]